MCFPFPLVAQRWLSDFKQAGQQGFAPLVAWFHACVIKSWMASVNSAVMTRLSGSAPAVGFVSYFHIDWVAATRNTCS
jgi:hypothetical protein